MMVKRAGLILSDLRADHDELEMVQKGGMGHARLRTFPVATAYLLPDLYVQLHKVLPGVHLIIDEGDELRLAERLSGGWGGDRPCSGSDRPAAPAPRSGA
ncbi:hypothetical protein [Sulfitobacter sp.]|uniref:hypothetical protein n=1 Tax=Sulfitobacter sp. TaxID=1903071 RepID=UPI0030038C4F